MLLSRVKTKMKGTEDQSHRVLFYSVSSDQVSEGAVEE